MKLEIVDGVMRLSINRGETVRLEGETLIYDGDDAPVEHLLTAADLEKVSNVLLANGLARRALSGLRPSPPENIR